MLIIPNVDNEWGIVLPFVAYFILYTTFMGSLALMLLINIIIQVIKDKKYKKALIKKYKIHLIVLIILIVLLIIGLISFSIYVYIYEKHKMKDTELAKQAVQEKDPHLCKQAHDTSLCYYKYARGSMDKSVCTRELVKDRLIPCNQIGEYGTNWGANYTY